MDNEKIWENITNKISGETSNSDEAAVKEWLNQNYENQKIFDRLLEIWKFNPKQVHDNSNIYRKYQQRVYQFENRRIVSSIVFYAIRISAVIFFLVGTYSILSSILTTPENEVAFQEISVAKGSRSTFNLPDGTKVWLSNNSTIRYPSKFIGDTRELEIKGEAYFEVTHIKSKPFIVNIGENRIKVLGTNFSVSAYPDDKKVRIDLIEGKVQFDVSDGKNGFKSYLLNPMHSLLLEKASGKLFDSKVPDGFYDYWNKGMYEFKNETLENLAIKIDRIYNTQFIFEDEALKCKRFSGTISIDDNIFTFLEAVKSTSKDPIEYRYKNNKLYIKLK